MTTKLKWRAAVASNPRANLSGRSIRSRGHGRVLATYRSGPTAHTRTEAVTRPPAASVSVTSTVNGASSGTQTA